MSLSCDVAGGNPDDDPYLVRDYMDLLAIRARYRARRASACRVAELDAGVAGTAIRFPACDVPTIADDGPPTLADPRDAAEDRAARRVARPAHGDR